VNPNSALLTDLYQLTMVQAYVEHGMDREASFEFFVRHMPPNRGFLVAAGLEQVVEFLEGFRFTDEELRWLRDTQGAKSSFVDYLADLRFEGEVAAMPEGTVFFPDEPILRVTAPITQAQLVETRIINLLQYQIMIASKAARCALAAPGKLLVDFGLRRTHGAESGLMAARASYLTGFSGSSTVLAGKAFGIPIYGTMAHSFIQAHRSEAGAFLDFARSHPDNVVLLIDTYDTEEGARKVTRIGPELRTEGIAIKAVRIDSGDLGAHAKAVRAILDEAGLSEITIFASGDLEEEALAGLLAQGAPIDGFGVGTKLDTSADAPYLNCAYKLVEYAGEPRRKRSEGKQTWPGRKQVFRRRGAGGRYSGDILAADGESQDGEPLLEVVMRQGRRGSEIPDVHVARERAAAQIAALPEDLKALHPKVTYPVEVSEGVHALARQADALHEKV
jgi:nicotinate phosphoribosyltransferase